MNERLLKPSSEQDSFKPGEEKNEQKWTTRKKEQKKPNPIRMKIVSSALDCIDNVWFILKFSINGKWSEYGFFLLCCHAFTGLVGTLCKSCDSLKIQSVKKCRKNGSFLHSAHSLALWKRKETKTTKRRKWRLTTWMRRRETEKKMGNKIHRITYGGHFIHFT